VNPAAASRFSLLWTACCGVWHATRIRLIAPSVSIDWDCIASLPAASDCDRNDSADANNLARKQVVGLTKRDTDLTSRDREAGKVQDLEDSYPCADIGTRARHFETMTGQS
jgi:hypothetical protein